MQQKGQVGEQEGERMECRRQATVKGKAGARAWQSRARRGGQRDGGNKIKPYGAELGICWKSGHKTEIKSKNKGRRDAELSARQSVRQVENKGRLGTDRGGGEQGQLGTEMETTQNVWCGGKTAG